MKKVLLIMMAALVAVSMPAVAQQKKTVKKRTTTTVKKKPVSQQVKIEMDEPCIAGGALAFNGIPINLSDAEMASEL